MKKIHVIAVCAILFIALVLWVLMTTQGAQNETEKSTQQEKQKTPESSETLTGKNTFANLFKLNEPLECTFSYSDEDRMNEGTVFVSGKQSRVESMYKDSADVTFVSSMIQNGEMMYMWGNAPQGNMAIKMRMPTSTQPSQTTSPDQFDLNAEVDYSCKPWRVDGSIFIPPTDVQFMDMDTMMKGMRDKMQQLDGIMLPPELGQ